MTMENLSVKAARNSDAIGKQAVLQGWVRTKRDSKAGFSFIELNDGSSQGNIQIIADNTIENYESEIKALTAGCSIRAEGEIKESGGKGQNTEMHAASVQVHGWADPDNYPLQKKRHSFEKLREWAHLRPRTNTFGGVARVRNCICNSIHQFFQEREFLYVHTPIITASDCEGAGEMFQVTTMDMEHIGKTQIEKLNYAFDFFDRPSYLTVSGQLSVETHCCSLGDVYTFGPTFRAENSNTSRHLAEFWMIEPEMAFADLNDNMDIAEAFLKRIVSDAMDKCGEDMEFFNARIDDTVLETLAHVREKDFVRLPYTQAIEILEKCGKEFEFPVSWGTDLQSEHERFLTEEHFKSPVILFDYPNTIKPFYMYCNDDDKTVRAMDVLVPKVGEIIGGSQREHRLDVLEKRMDAQDLIKEDYWWYTDLRKYGTIPHAGFGLGLERAVQFVTGMANIRDVIPFPRTPGNAEF